MTHVKPRKSLNVNEYNTMAVAETSVSDTMKCYSLRQYNRKGMVLSVTILGVALLTVFLAYIAFGDATDRSDPATVRYVAIIQRHGDRSPTGAYPTDPHKDHKWRGGSGALSLKGSRQMYDSGTNLRARYFRLMPSDGYYTKDIVLVTSSFAERCIMSAQCFLAGFMPPLETLNPLPIRWQPIPINSLPRDRDNLLAQKMACPKYDAMLAKMYTDPPEDLAKFNQENAELFSYLTNHTGKSISNVADAEELFNILIIEQDNGLTLPDWTESVFPDKLLVLAERNLAVLTETPYMKRAKAGPLLTDIVKQMTKKRSGDLIDTDSAANAALAALSVNYGDKATDRSIAIYSGHDVTLTSLMRALDVIDQTSRKPDYGAALGIELHQGYNDQNDFEIKLVYYFNGDDKMPKTLTIPKCEAPCTFTRFVESIKDLLVPDFADACKLN